MDQNYKGNILWNSKRLPDFQTRRKFCIILVVVASLLFRDCSTGLLRSAAKGYEEELELELELELVKETSSKPSCKVASCCFFFRALLRSCLALEFSRCCRVGFGSGKTGPLTFGPKADA